MSRRGHRVGILGHTGRPGVRRAAQHLAASLMRHGHDVELEQLLAREMQRPGRPLGALARWSEVLVTLGGDGTALKGARALAGRRGTLLPVNLGGLGFLTSAEEPELERAVRAALAGEWPAARRRLLQATVRRRGKPIHRGLAMNDAVIKASGGYAALHLRVHALGSDLGHLVADGLIAASAAGSTAYSLSAGGPVLAPDLEALVVTPVCPHTLGSRSLVLPPGAALGVRVLGSFDVPSLLLDGQDRVDLEADDGLEVALGRAAARVFLNPDRPLARALQKKLGWQGSPWRSMS
jgi:NAD+ kinase